MAKRRKSLTSVARSVMSKASQTRFSKNSAARTKSAQQSSGTLGVTNSKNYRYVAGSNRGIPVFNRRTGLQIGAFRGV